MLVPTRQGGELAFFILFYFILFFFILPVTKCKIYHFQIFDGLVWGRGALTNIFVSHYLYIYIYFF